MSYTRDKAVGDFIIKLGAFIIMLVVASWLWTHARDEFAVLFGKHVADLSFGGMMLCLLFLRISYRAVVYAGSDEIPKAGK